MVLLTADNISKSFADRVILHDVSFTISDGDKIGVIGINGTGKSTLLKMIAGLEPANAGQLIRMRGLRIEYLPQQPEFPDDSDVLQAVLHGHSPQLRLIREYEAAALALAGQPDNTSFQNRLIRLSSQMDESGAWHLDSEIKSILTRLGIFDFNQKTNTLSGGQKKRVALAAALVNPADLLILDEPTNHIDAAAIEWLEQMLANFKGALLMVTHDRYFLERVTGVMLEIDRGLVFRYEANYDRWLELKAERIEREQSSELKRQNLLRRELAWIRRGAKARSTKQQARIDRFNTLNEKSAPNSDDQLSISAAASRLGRKTLILENISQAVSGKTLIKDFSYIISRDERLGIIGPNGCGKSTLLKIIAGQLEPDHGRCSSGSTVRLGFFKQENEDIEPDLRVIDYIREAAEVVKTDEGELNAAQMLEKFLFPPALQWKPVRLLSGGERRRLYLLRILMGAPNILLLDEPANDLDIATLSVLEDYLDGFKGAVVTVSHDRYFLDRIAGRILAFQTDGSIRQFEGNYQAYSEQIKAEEIEKTPAAAQVLPAKTKQAKTSRQTEAAKPRLKMSEKQELNSIDGKVAELETRLSAIQAELADSSSDYQRLGQLADELAAVTAEYDKTMDRWLYLNELAEQAGQV